MLVVSSRSKEFLAHFTKSRSFLDFLFDFLVSLNCVTSSIITFCRALVHYLCTNQCHSLEPRECWDDCHVPLKHALIPWTPPCKSRDKKRLTFPLSFLLIWPKPFHMSTLWARQQTRQYPGGLYVSNLLQTSPWLRESVAFFPSFICEFGVPQFCPYFPVPPIRIQHLTS